MKINKNDLEQLPILSIPKDMRSTDKLYLRNKIIYKVFGENSFISEKNRNIDYLIQNKIPNTPKIYTKLYKDNEFCGYTMEYIENALSFRQALKKDIPEAEKIKAIKDVYESMKYLHTQGIYLGDIHSDNMLITKENGYIVDLEEMRFPGDDFKFKQCVILLDQYIRN